LFFDLVTILVSVGLTGTMLGYTVNGTARALDLARRSKDALAERTRELEASQRVTFTASERVSPDYLSKPIQALELIDIVAAHYPSVDGRAPPDSSSTSGRERA
jgi:hypothetical protein